MTQDIKSWVADIKYQIIVMVKGKKKIVIFDK